MTESAATRLRELLNAPGMLLAPGVGDGVSAQIARDTGYEVLWGSGFCASARRGLADIGVATMTEMVSNAGMLVEAVPEVPILADADNGYGPPVNVRRAVQAFERVGVAGIQLEDQVSPKKCGFLAGKKVISQRAMEQKIRAAREACRNKDFVLLARTDARAVHGLDDAIARALANLDAGADVVVIEAPRSMEELTRISRHFRDRPGKLVINRVVSDLIDWPDTAVLESLGATLLLDSTAVLAASAHATRECLQHLKDGRHPALLPQYSFRELTEATGLRELQRWEQEYDDAEVAAVR